MRKATRNTLLLAAAVVLLGVAAFAELKREEKLLPASLTSLNVANLKSLQIRCAGCRTRRFEHRVNGWWMIEPYPIRADDAVVTRLAAIANAPIRVTLDAHAYDAKKLGLDPPAISLTFDDVAIDVGGEDPIEHDRYVRIGDRLVRVPDRFGARLLESPETEIDRHLIDVDAVLVDVGIDGAAPRADLAAAWKNTLAAQMQPSEKNEHNTKQIVIEFADATKLAFSIRRDNDHYVVRRKDIDLDYLFSEAQAQALLGAAN
ncbi:MAG: DUF4340 domain-containing protein [Rudaea sp.]